MDEQAPLAAIDAAPPPPPPPPQRQQFDCPGCKSTFQVPADSASAQCPACGAVIQLLPPAVVAVEAPLVCGRWNAHNCYVCVSIIVVLSVAIFLLVMWFAVKSMT